MPMGIESRGFFRRHTAVVTLLILFGVSGCGVVSDPPTSAQGTKSTTQAALAISTASPLLSAEVGAPYQSGFLATGGSSPYTWTIVAGTPTPGLSLASGTGLLSGTPTQAGTFSFTVQVQDSGGHSAEGLFSQTVVSLVSVTTTSLAQGVLGVPYSAALGASGGTAPYGWSLVSGQLPTGLSLASSGQISGTPGATGSYSFTVKVSDSSNPAQSATALLSIVVAAPVLAVTTSSLPGATVGVSYSATLQAGGGTTPYSWSLASGQLPPGLGLAASGQITGAPSAGGQYSFTVKVQDSSSTPQTATASLSINVLASLVITTASLPNATLNTSYSATLAASGGTAPYTWTLSSGTLPAGLSLASNGQVSGTPTTAGNSSFTVKVVDSSASPQTASGPFTVTVVSSSSSLAIQTATLPGGAVGASYSASLQASGGTTPYSWSLSSGQLPPGLSLATSGQISGTPSASGGYSFTVKIADSSSPVQTATASLSITVAAAPLAVTTSSLPGATVGVSYSATLQASGGITPYGWSLASGQLPPGLGLSTSGQISGSPSASGQYTFTAKVQDSSPTPLTATASMSITVASATLTVTTSSLPGATVGLSYSSTLQASGGTTPYNWSLASGQLPSGLSLSTSGQISGTPSASGTYSFTVKVTDSSSPAKTATASLSITVASSGFTVTTSSLAGATVGVSYSSTLQASGGTTPYSWSLASGQLPTGLSLSTSGQISGTPTASGAFSFTAKVTDSSKPAQTATSALSITVAAPALTLIPTSINFGNVPVGQTPTQSVKLTNSGNATLTVSQATITGSEFSMTGLTLPLSLGAGQSTYFTVQFSPTAAGSAAGNVSLVSNDPNSPTNMALSGTSHWVSLNWTASTSTVVGYYVYRGTQSGGPYTQLNSTPVTTTTFDDSTVTSGQTYYYVVTAVDSNNVQSVYSNQVVAAVPSP
jgi:hypothetical protein